MPSKQVLFKWQCHNAHGWYGVILNIFQILQQSLCGGSLGSLGLSAEFALLRSPHDDELIEEEEVVMKMKKERWFI